MGIKGVDWLHPIFVGPISSDAKLWRYLSFAKFVALVQTKSLHFTRVDRFGDHFEGAWPKEDAQFFREKAKFDVVAISEQFRRMTAACCWVEGKNESAGMWQLYAGGKEGVAVSTSYQRLLGALRPFDDGGKGQVCGAGRVTYMDHAQDGFIAALKPNEPLPNMLAPLMTKHVGYSHEREVRALYVSQFGGAEIDEKGWRLPIEPSEFIEDIVVNPFFESWFFEAVREFSHTFGLKSAVRESTLAPSQFYQKNSHASPSAAFKMDGD